MIKVMGVLIMIDINSAGSEELTQIKGIGSWTAECIVDYRQENDGFEELEELKKVRGIGEIKFEKIKSNLTAEERREEVTVEFDPDLMGVEEPEEVHLVGEMNDWDPADRSYRLKRDEDGIWKNTFHLKPGTEYKIMYDSSSWEEEKHIGYHGENFVV